MGQHVLRNAATVVLQQIHYSRDEVLRLDLGDVIDEPSKVGRPAKHLLDRFDSLHRGRRSVLLDVLGDRVRDLVHGLGVRRRVLHDLRGERGLELHLERRVVVRVAFDRGRSRRGRRRLLSDGGLNAGGVGLRRSCRRRSGGRAGSRRRALGCRRGWRLRGRGTARLRRRRRARRRRCDRACGGRGGAPAAAGGGVPCGAAAPGAAPPPAAEAVDAPAACAGEAAVFGALVDGGAGTAEAVAPGPLGGVCLASVAACGVASGHLRLRAQRQQRRRDRLQLRFQARNQPD